MIWLKIGGGAFVALVLISSGWRAKGIVVAAEHAKALKTAQALHAAELNALQADLDNAAAETIRLSAELDAAQSNTRTVTREVIREVPKYAPVSTPQCDCSLPAGLVGLHNSAARGRAPDTESDGPAAREPSYTLPLAGYSSD